MAEKDLKEEAKDVAENIKEGAKKATKEIREGAKKVYSENDDLFDKCVDFIKTNAGLLIGAIVGLILVLTKVSSFLLNVMFIVVSAIVGYYVQKKLVEKENKNK